MGRKAMACQAARAGLGLPLEVRNSIEGTKEGPFDKRPSMAENDEPILFVG